MVKSLACSQPSLSFILRFLLLPVASFHSLFITFPSRKSQVPLDSDFFFFFFFISVHSVGSCNSCQIYLDFDMIGAGKHRLYLPRVLFRKRDAKYKIVISAAFHLHSLSLQEHPRLAICANANS
ncbi:hypothetical protein BCR41DRAFT_77714 [Lobosporangium transversale]|uniref:Uncharacterized protein n=1 Tax=Lobosporangium transversale TaxID=64571 RepID=A0A1Y2GNC1_9FUNG|nr:hypothetical protein BCR41DRAFT_77714 [Lobosporangium transversale]ORZ14857.1 hypothetical protein BCR41DRAFT_77714 [Lobosporangium transversale]|eukprot:XP_021880989.1 hypothetical protein BCR41DRAFT_77714 [Lobosporangium transversale]